MLIRLLRLFAVLWLGFLMPASAVQVFTPITIEQATVTIFRDGVEQQASHTVRLPYHWDKLNGAVDGQAHFVMRYPLTDTTVPAVLYIPRIGNRYSVTLNGRTLPISSLELRTAPADSAYIPQLVAIPVEWQSTDNVLTVTIHTVGGKYGGLSQVVMGPESAVHPMFAQRYFWEVTSRQLLAVVTAMLGLFGVLLWWRGGERAYLYYGWAELLWTILTVRTLVNEPVHFLFLWTFFSYLLPLTASPPLLYRGVLVVLGLDHPWLPRMLNGLALLAVPLAATVALGHAPWLVMAWSGLMTLIVMFLAGKSLALAAKHRSREATALAVLLCLLVVSTLRDLGVNLLSPDAYVSVYWLRFAWIGIGVAFVWIVAERMRKTSQSLAEMNATLSDQLASRNAELTALFERERESEKERGASEERQRVMRDLHDGLGSQLVGALRMSQKPTTSRTEISSQLRDAIDQLKITVDALQETDGDIASLLGAIRYRLAPRLQAAGIDLRWDVGHLQRRADWGPRDAYQLQMILFEAFSNMIVHSEASIANLRAHETGEAGHSTVDIEIIDNGKGFLTADAATSMGKGMSNMRMRAKLLGIDLCLQSQPGETKVRMTLPFQALVAV